MKGVAAKDEVSTGEREERWTLTVAPVSMAIAIAVVKIREQWIGLDVWHCCKRCSRVSTLPSLLEPGWAG
jgi:hypothetical protein